MTPRIAIPVPTTTDLAYNQRSWPQYESAIIRSGGEAVSVPLTLSPAELRELLTTIDGILLPGSPADVDPARYAADRDPATNAADPAREAIDYALLDDAVRNGKPALCICFGVQSMNVWRGGSLVQDLAPIPVNHSAGASVAVAHSILIAKETTLASLVDPTEAGCPIHDAASPQHEWGTNSQLQGDFLRLPINTSHHQSVASPGDGLRVVARCPEDGIIEAVELDPEMFHVAHSGGLPPEHPRSQFLLGVQWHPERSYDISPTSRNLFHRLVAEARAYAEASAPTS